MIFRNSNIPLWGLMIVQVGDMIRIDPYTELSDEWGNSHVSGEEIVAMVIKWYGDVDWQEIELLVNGEILYLKDNWDKIGFAFRRLENDNSDRRCYAESIRERLDNYQGREHKS